MWLHQRLVVLQVPADDSLYRIAVSKNIYLMSSLSNFYQGSKGLFTVDGVTIQL